jgi:hypothetical protein
MEELGFDHGGVAEDLNDCSLETGHSSILSPTLG